MTKKQIESFLYVLAAISGFLLLRASNLSWPTKIVLILFTIIFCGTFVVILEWLERRDFESNHAIKSNSLQKKKLLSGEISASSQAKS